MPSTLRLYLTLSDINGTALSFFYHSQMMRIIIHNITIDFFLVSVVFFITKEKKLSSLCDDFDAVRNCLITFLFLLASPFNFFFMFCVLG